jgi:hypothetical protein
MRHRYRDSVTILNAPQVTGYGGQEVRNWDAAVPTPDVPADIYPVNTQSGSIEVTDRRELTITSWTLHCAATWPITATSRVRWAGAPGDLEVDGEVGVHPFHGLPHHVEATLRLVRDD